ncbi:hypothetical protein GTU99_00185 [Streptomyces sp. PRKS01-65]|nr:hypothetical protein [Streptomyces harenosi]
MALRHGAVATLGEHFGSTVDVRPARPVVRTGRYRHLRHPSYAGALLMAACAGFCLDHPLSTSSRVLHPGRNAAPHPCRGHRAHRRPGLRLRRLRLRHRASHPRVR